MPNSKSSEIREFIIKNTLGTEIGICNYGASITKFIVDLNGDKTDIVLGFDNLNDYQINECYVGVTIGRYANRIAKAHYKIDDNDFYLQPNNNSNCLHSGEDGYHHQIWDVEKYTPNEMILNYYEPENLGFAGNMNISVKFLITETNELYIDYEAVADKKTVINLTNHAYFNLNGSLNGTCINHTMKINADHILEINQFAIPTGKYIAVKNTPFDFRESKKIGEHIENNHDQLINGGGYDHNFIINNYDGNLKFAAEAIGEISNIKLTVYTTEPGLQFYTGNFLNDAKGKNNQIHFKRSAFCLETQHFPDSPNHQHFPSTTLEKGKIFTSQTVYKVDFL